MAVSTSVDVSPDQFRDALSRFASGVTVLTAATDDGPVGMTVSSFASVSLDPPLILVCVARSAASYEAFQEAQAFCLSILGADQTETAAEFSRSGNEKFAGLDFEPSPTAGAPLLRGAVAHLECVTYDRHAAGDHIIVVGEVIWCDARGGPPLVHCERQYGTFQQR